MVVLLKQYVDLYSVKWIRGCDPSTVVAVRYGIPQDIYIGMCGYIVYCLFLFFTVTDFSGEDKAANGVKFFTLIPGRPGQGISPFWGNFAPPEAQNRTNRPPTRK